MAKKSAPTRPAARKPVATGKQTAVALVRTPRVESGFSTTPAMKATVKQTAPTAARGGNVSAPTQVAPGVGQKPIIVAPAARPRVPEVKAARPAPAPKVEAAAARQTQASRAQLSSVARARAVQRARAAHAISPEQYGYVRKDLRLIAGLAISMFAIIIILHFALPQ